jgi:hypothetical protein
VSIVLGNAACSDTNTWDFGTLVPVTRSGESLSGCGELAGWSRSGRGPFTKGSGPCGSNPPAVIRDCGAPRWRRDIAHARACIIQLQMIEGSE